MNRVILAVIAFVFACSTERMGETVDRLGGQTNLPSGGTGCSIDEETGVCRCLSSPIIVDLDGDGFHLSGPDEGVVFQLQSGRSWLWSWPLSAGDAFLVLDVNRNGRIDSGAEMFGDGALQAFTANPNGFLAMAFYDRPENGGNGNNRLDPGDEVWSQLRLWRDNHDGVSQPEELVTLDKATIHSISLDYSPSTVVDDNGNVFLFSGSIVADAPVSPTIYDVWLQSSKALHPTPRPDGKTSNDYAIVTCKAWGYTVAESSPPFDGPQTPCSLPSVLTDPVIDLQPEFPQLHLLARLVLRYRSVTGDYGAALGAAQNAVSDSLHSTPYPWPPGTSCRSLYPHKPSPDPVAPGVYTFDAVNPWALCTTQTITSPPPSTGGC